MMAEGEELWTDCYDEAGTGFAVSEDSSPPAIRERASLMVSVVFFAAM